MSLTHPTTLFRAATAVAALSLAGPLHAGEPGKMTREVWNQIPGGNIADFTASSRYWQTADAVATFPGAVAPSNAGDNFAARVRAYVTAPVSGNYIFWIASDDASELWLSPNDSKFGRVKIASVSGWTDPQAWDAKTSQKSVPIALVAGQRYFIEALHKDGGWADHLAIAWQAPGGAREVIPASALESFTVAPADLDNDELRDSWEIAHNFDPADNGSLHPDQLATADPDHDGYTNLEESDFGTDPMVRAGIPGTLLLETWNNVSGTAIRDLTLEPRFYGAPDKAELVFSAATTVNRADRFGARMRGYVIAPATGSYTFHISGDDACELWLSPSESQFAKQRIASVPSWTNVNQWNRFPSQASETISLVVGQKVYIEAIQKEGTGGDHLEIGWKTPGSGAITVIPGTSLESYAFDAADPDGDNMPADWETAHNLDPAANDAAADPDGDAVPNALEYAVGTDPQVKSTIAGALLHELWWNVPGERIKDIVSSKRMLQVPDLVNLATSAQGPVNFGDGYGDRLRGYLTAPVSGAYIFWAAGDEAMEFWLSTSESQFDKELLVRPAIITQNYDADISLKSHVVTLIAGQRYYLEMLHIDGHAWDYCQVAWKKPGGVREIIPGAVLETFVPTADDQDDDGLPDTWEIANGLSPNDNGHIDPKNGAHGDLDGDGLDNAAEWKAGTRADLADTDGDGVSDYDEVNFFDSATLASDIGAFTPVTTIPGAAYTSAFGEFLNADGKARQNGRRGSVTYPITVPASGIHALKFSISSLVGGTRSENYEFDIILNGHRIGYKTIQICPDGTGILALLTPWLNAGETYNLELFVDNSYNFRRVSIDSLQILAAGGTDSNTNGTPDWVDIRIHDTNGFDRLTQYSKTSPATVEGKCKYPDLVNTNGVTIFKAPNGHFFTEVPLTPGAVNTLDFSFENGAVSETSTVQWSPTNVLLENNLTIRQGDSLLLTAFQDAENANLESYSFTANGQAYTQTADQPTVVAFTTPGIINIQLTHTSADVAMSTIRTITVTVLPLVSIPAPLCVTGYQRLWTHPALPAGTSLQIDDQITRWQETTANTYTLLSNTPENQPALIRYGAAGPILGSIEIKSITIRSGDMTGNLVTESYPTYDVVELPVTFNGDIGTAEIRCEIIIGGVTFTDGTTVKSLFRSSFDEFNSCKLYFNKSTSSPSNCHRYSVWHNNTRVAYFN